ncbi:MAG: CHAT domain-containing protein [Desulfomonile tiedjei]|nr:CHAT domain-containing protein [Desulfomonile tiedjei]
MRFAIATLLVSIFALGLGVGTGCCQSKQEAMRLLNEARKLSADGRPIEDTKKAVDKLAQAIAILEKLGLKEAVASVAISRGVGLKELGDFEQAAKSYLKSLAIKRELGDREGQAELLQELGIVYDALNRPLTALQYYDQAQAIQKELGGKKALGQILNNMGVVYKNLGRYGAALDHFQRALAIKREVADRKEEAQTLRSMGTVYQSIGNSAKAMESYQQVLNVRREIGDRVGEADCINDLGSVYLDWGKYAKAKEYWTSTLSMAKELESPILEYNSLHNLGLVMESLGEYTSALANFERAQQVWLAMARNPLKSGALKRMWTMRARVQGTEAAVPLIENEVRSYEAAGKSSESLQPLLATLYLDLGETEKAEPIVRSGGLFANLGRLNLLKARYPAARGYYRQLIKAAETSKNADDLFMGYTGFGTASEELGDLPGAEASFRKAVDHTEQIRAQLNRGDREKFFDVRVGGFYRTAPYEGLARVLTKLNRPAEAFKTSEYTKARVFAESLSSVQEGTGFDLPQEVIQRDADLSDQLSALKRNQQSAYERNNEEAVTSLGSQIKGIEGQLSSHIKDLRRDYPLFAATKYPEPMDLDQTALTDGEWALSFDVTDTCVLVYLTRGKTLVKTLLKPILRKDLDALVRSFREPLEVGSDQEVVKKLSTFDFISGRKLSELLLGEVLADVPPNEPILIVPDDSLGVLPFEMLVIGGAGEVKTDKKIPYVSGAEFLGDRNPVSYYQSITALTLARGAAKAGLPADRLLVMADPVFEPDDPRIKELGQQRQEVLLKGLPERLMSVKMETGVTFPRLPLTGELSNFLKDLNPDVTDQYTGLQAVKWVLLEKPLNRYGSMVFATHGYFGKDIPGVQEPVLVLSLVNQEAEGDGFLRMTEVMGLKINADMVVLTACQTGLGARITGEGTMGMGRAFQYAGAKSVLMSLWSVAEISSVTLMESFFKQMKTGKNKLAALKLARDEIRKNGYDHPFFWAPFILVGETD